MSKKRGNNYVNTGSYSSKTLNENIGILNHNIQLCREYKQNTIKYVKKLKDQHSRGIFSYTEYEYMLNRYLKGKNLEYWLDHYDEKEKQLQDKIKRLRFEKPRQTLETQVIYAEKKQKKFNFKYGLAAFIFLIGLSFVFYMTFGELDLLTGLTILGEVDSSIILDYSPIENPIIQESQTQTFSVITAAQNETYFIQWYVDEFPVAGETETTFDYKTKEPGEYEIKVLVNNLKDYTTKRWAVTVEGETTVEEQPEEVVEENVSEPVVPEEDSTESEVIPEENITVPEEVIDTNETIEENATEPVEPENVTEEIEPEFIPEENVTEPVEPENVTEEIGPEIIPEENITEPEKIEILEGKIEDIKQLPAEINNPVQWILRVKSSNGTYLTIEIPDQASAISVDRIIKVPTLIIGKVKEAVPKEDIMIKKGSSSVSLSTYEITGQSVTGFFISNIQEKGVLSTVTNWASFKFLIYKVFFSISNNLSSVWDSITGHTLTNVATLAVQGEKQGTIIILENNAEEFEIRYQTPPPKVREFQQDDKKIVTVYAEMNYTNVLTYTTIEENRDVLGVYWLTNESKLNMTYDTYDENSNGFVDKVSWITPHLSEQTFEILLNISKEVLLNESNKPINYSNSRIIPVSSLNYFINCPSATCGFFMNHGYVEYSDYFCTVTNSRQTEPKGADLSAGLEFDISNISENYEIADVCFYTLSSGKSILDEGIPKIHIKEEDTEIQLLQPSITNEMDDLPLIEVTDIPGWLCSSIIPLLDDTLSKGKARLNLRVVGQNLEDRKKDQYACFRGISQDALNCSEEYQEVPSDCRPFIRLKWN
ncbi:MAG: hypothetical protein KKA79_04385 [Nanoarchaeota archaeon]|nr:hypothetical protein [Nanoarchaeota archaeon]